MGIAFAVASPWIVGPLATIWRVRRSRDLRDEPGTPPPNAPLVSVIVPARNERRNIESCVRAVLDGDYRDIELIIVDDRSTDGTADAARLAAGGDARVRIVENPELPEGWFGKPWACATGAANAHGQILCFTDADARHGPHLIARAVTAMIGRDLGMLSVAGHQELGSFWERIVQPQVFWMLATRYGGTDAINASPRAWDKIANGQCIFVRRAAYDAIGGHGAVHDRVAEDVALAQRLFSAGQRTELVLGEEDLTTRMYTSLGEIMAGWRKNVFAGGRDAMPWGRIGQIIFPALLLTSPVLTALPPIVLAAASLMGAPPWLVLAASIAVIAEVATWVAVYRWMRAPIRYALLFPLGAAVFAVIAIQAIARGARVEWKGRAYVTTSRAPRTSR